MSKTVFTQEIKNEYKQQTRYIRTKAELKLGGKRPGINLLPAYNINRRIHGTRYDDITINIKNWDCSINGYYAVPQSGGVGLNFDISFTLPAGTYTFTMIREVSRGNQSDNSFFNITIPYKRTSDASYYSFITLGSGNGVTTEKQYISQTVTFDFDQEIGVDELGKITLLVSPSGDVEQIYKENFKIMINEGTERWPWWEGGNTDGLVDDDFTLGEDGISEIIDFKVDETSDIYYEKMPYNELIINTDNTKGYFSDFNENSIVSKLTKDVVMKFYLNINDTGWINAWTMQFDSLNADNDRARLIFKPRCLRIFDSEIYDIQRYFYTYNILSWPNFDNFISTNYNVSLWSSDTNGGINTNDTHILKKVSDMFVEYACDLKNNQVPKLLTINDNNVLEFRNIQYTSLANSNENITTNELLEKPLITKENLSGVVINYRKIKSLSQNTKKFQKSITADFKKATQTLVIFCENLNAREILQNNITLTNATLNWYGVSNDNLNIASRYLIIEIQGNVGDQYTININAELHEIELDENQGTFFDNENEDKDNFIQVDGFSNGMYWINLKNKMKKKVKLKIIGLPYLQVGDSITFEESGKTISLDDKIVITEIHTSWSNGFIMEIIGYKVDA